MRSQDVNQASLLRLKGEKWARPAAKIAGDIDSRWHSYWLYSQSGKFCRLKNVNQNKVHDCKY